MHLLPHIRVSGVTTIIYLLCCWLADDVRDREYDACAAFLRGMMMLLCPMTDDVMWIFFVLCVILT